MNTTSKPRPLRAALAVAAVLAAMLLSAVATPATAAVRVPPVPSGLPLAIEGLSPYVPNTGCDQVVRPGVVKLGNLIKATYANSYSTIRPCTSATRPSSEHFDGRAIDTFFSVRNTTRRAQATALISWLLAKDRYGRPYANARRLGIMYLIWNNKIWATYRPADGWRPYLNCASTPSAAYDTTCHRDHIHISLSWEGAMGRTSFWSKRVASVDWGPCRPYDLNWSAGYSTFNVHRCPSYRTVTAPAGASSLLRALVPRSGMVLRPGMSGTAVSVLQRAIGLTPTGNFLTLTTARLKAWQRAHGLVASGVAYASTWRVLLRVNGMR